MSCLCVVLLLAGCGEAGPDRVAVSGVVNLDGKPLNNAYIVFSPEGETKGPKAKAIITDGKYQLKEEHGPFIGKMRVEIQSVGMEEEEFQKVRLEGKSPVVMKVFIPESYNVESQLKAETKLDKENVFNFDLKTEE